MNATLAFFLGLTCSTTALCLSQDSAEDAKTIRAERIELRHKADSNQRVVLEAVAGGYLSISFGEDERPHATLHLGTDAGAFGVSIETLGGGSMQLRLAEGDTRFTLRAGAEQMGVVDLQASKDGAWIDFYDNPVASGSGTGVSSRECSLGVRKGSGFLELRQRQGAVRPMWADLLVIESP